MFNTFLVWQTVSFNYWNDVSWSGTLHVEYWIEMNGNRTLLIHFENGIQPTEIDQDIKLIVEFKDLQLGFKKGKLRGKDHDKYFFLECSLSASFQNAESRGLSSLIERPIRLQEGGESVYLPFNVMIEAELIALAHNLVKIAKNYPSLRPPSRAVSVKQIN